MKTVRFIKMAYVKDRQYLPGQAHEFEDAVSDSLVKDGVAQDANKPMPAEKQENEPKKKKITKAKK